MTDRVVELLGRCRALVERLTDSIVALARQAGVIAVPRDELGVVLGGGFGDDRGRIAAPNEQFGIALAVRRSEVAQGVEHERDARCACVRQNVVVEYEESERSSRGVRQAAVVREPEVPTMPVKSHCVAFASTPGKPGVPVAFYR